MVFQAPKKLILCLIITIVVSAWSAEPFPTDALPGVSIGDKLPSNHETSGIVWHSGIQKFFLVSDGGIVSSMSSKGTKLTHWEVDGDLEAVTVARPQSDFIYLGIEHPDSICEFNLTTGQVTRTFDLTDWMDGPDNSGLEALTFVPDPDDPEGGLFYAGLQDNGRLFVFRLPILSSITSTSVTYIRTIPAIDGIENISDMSYVASQGVIYIIYDKDDLLRAMETDGTLISEWNLPGSDQEGVALKGNELYISEDFGGDGGDVLRYAPFMSLPQPDLDADGKVTLSDFAQIAACWNSSTLCETADLNGDNTVDTADIALWSEYWLQGI